MGSPVAGPGVVLVALLLSVYTYCVTASLPPGRSRLLTVLPVIVVFTALPWAFDVETQPVGAGFTFWILTWLASFKLLSFCAGRGILADPWISSSAVTFCLAMSLPLHLRPAQRRNSVTEPKLAGSNPDSRFAPQQSRVCGNAEGKGGETVSELLPRAGVKLAVFYLVLQVYSVPGLPTFVVEAAYCVSIYLFITIVCETVAAFALAVSDVVIKPHFDQPYLAGSFQEFWARRWNVTVSSCLRDTVYVPALEALSMTSYASVKPEVATAGAPGEKSVGRTHGNASSQNSSQGQSLKGDADVPTEGTVSRSAKWDCGVRREGEGFAWTARPSPLAQVVATVLVFLVSGIMHELALHYICRIVTGEMLAFFLLHAVLVSLEVSIKRAGLLRPLPRWLRVPLVVLATFVSAHYLFFPPFVRCGAPDRFVRQVRSWVGQTS